MKEWTTPDSRNTPSSTNLEEEEIVDALGNDGNASMPEQVKRPNPWRKMITMMNSSFEMPVINFEQLGVTTPGANLHVKYQIMKPYLKNSVVVSEKLRGTKPLIYQPISCVRWSPTAATYTANLPNTGSAEPNRRYTYCQSAKHRFGGAQPPLHTLQICQTQVR